MCGGIKPPLGRISGVQSSSNKKNIRLIISTSSVLQAEGKSIHSLRRCLFSTPVCARHSYVRELSQKEAAHRIYNRVQQVWNSAPGDRVIRK